MQNIEQITARLQAMTVSVVSSKDTKGYDASRKVADIVTGVRCGRYRVARLESADKTLSKWGF